MYTLTCACKTTDGTLIPQHRGPHHWHACWKYESPPIPKPAWVIAREQRVAERGLVAEHELGTRR